MTELEREFALACETTIAECRSLGYTPSIWMQMIQKHGAVDTARRLVVSGDLQDGFRRLLSMGRADLTVESSVLDERWYDLFTDQEREVARWRLEAAQKER